LPAAVNPSMPTRSRPPPPATTRSATSANNAERCSDAQDGSGCCHVDTDNSTAAESPSMSEIYRNQPEARARLLGPVTAVGSIPYGQTARRAAYSS
jgi:hypothetical protein